MAKQPEIVLVGPTHPYSGGIAQHTTRLALEIEQRGRVVRVESWSHQYPSFLYKGTGRVPNNEVEIGLAENVLEELSWYSPLSWWRAGHRSRHSATLIVTIPTPLHLIPYTFLLAGAGRIPRRVGIVHNALPHERFLGDRLLMSLLLKQLDTAVVHNSGSANEVSRLAGGRTAVAVRTLPSPWTSTSDLKDEKSKRTGPTRLLFFGTIRPYKGVDLLVEALAKTKDVTLTVAGEFWESVEPYEDLIRNLRLEDRVSITPGYVQASDFSDLFSSADALVLPYRSATGSIVRELGFDFGLPVIATNVGSLAEGIIENENGYVVSPDDVTSLAEAINKLSEPRVLDRLKAGARNLLANRSTLWARYLDAIIET